MTATCQCDRAAEPCTRPITQEDLRCDVCRTRCASIQVEGIPALSGHHVRMRLWPGQG